MKVKQFIIGILAIAMTLVLAGAAWSDNRHHDRQRKKNKQMHRIYKGVKKGEITKKEYRKLLREQNKIQNVRKKARADGRITRNERIRLTNLRRQADRHIYIANHNHHKRHYHKPKDHWRYHHKHKRHYKHYPRYRYRDHYRGDCYHPNDYYFSGTWLEPNWGFSFYTSDPYRR